MNRPDPERQENSTRFSLRLCVSALKKFEFPGVLAASLILALAASWTQLGTQIDNDAYDWMFRLHRPPDWQPQSMLLAIDEASLKSVGGMRRLRPALAEGLELLSRVPTRAVAIDVLLPEDGDPADDSRLETAIRNTPRVVLSCDLFPDAGRWEDPIDRFRRVAAGVGHVHAHPDPVSRFILLEKVAGHDRRWALALETFRAAHGKPIVETPEDLEIGGVLIPISRAEDRAMRIRYLPPDRPVPRVTLSELRANPSLAARFAGKTVFVGLTAQTGVTDQLQTPYSNNSVPMPGVEINANAFETIANRLFLTTAPAWMTLGICLLLAAAAGACFSLLAGRPSYLAGAAVLGLAHVLPYLSFTHSIVLPFTPPVFSAWLSISTAAAYQYFVVRHRMLRAEVERLRYQQAMHFVTHEMRTPLTAIQGSSELIGRYAMTEDKRKQIAQLINTESKRLGKMIEIFLNVERLSAGHMDLKKEMFNGMDLMADCIARVLPLADRKQIRISLDRDCESTLTGDRELMDYAFYNLLTNAVKYSPPSTEVSVFGRREPERIRISVKDQGIGIDQKEVRKIFQKFYRTRKAEQSGESGTGIGLSIVEQIIQQHGGSIEVTSSPGKGSCFTLVLPAQRVASVAEQER